MLIVITFITFSKRKLFISRTIYYKLPFIFSLLSVVVPELFCNLYPQAWIPSGLGCTIRNRRCAKLNFSPLFRFFFFRLRREGRTALSLEETVRKAWSKGTQKWLPHPFPHACLLVTLARIEEVFQRMHCFSHLHHGAIAYTRMAMKSVDHCRLMRRRNAGK